MPRIVSGADEFNPDAALLRGTAIGREWGQARNERDAEQRKHYEALLEFHKEMARVKKAEGDALEKVAQGKKDAKALATHAALLEREKLNPRFRAVVERKGLVEKSLKGMAERGVSEETIQRVIQHVKGTEESLRQQDQDQQFEEFLGGFDKHAAVPPEDVQAARQQAAMGGNRAEIAKGLIDKKNKATADATFKDLNDRAVQRAAQMVEALEPGTLQHAQATAVLFDYQNDTKRQMTSGEGAKVYDEVLKIAGGETDDEYQHFRKAQQALQEQQGQESLGRMNAPLYKPPASQMNTQAAFGRGQARDAGQGYSWDFSSGSPASGGGASDMPQMPTPVLPQAQAAQLIQWLRANGQPVTEKNLQEAARALAANAGS